MKYRKLRIAWSVACGVVCLLLIALWVRSYWSKDQLMRVSNDLYLFAATRPGLFVIEWARFPTDPGDSRWEFDAWPYEFWPPSDYHSQLVPFALRDTSHADIAVFIPFWLLALVHVFLAAFPWMRWRFSLRTLLITATVVAVGLAVTVILKR